MTLDRTITELADLVGFSLYYIFKFFEALSVGYVLILMVFTLFFIVLIYFKYINKRILHA